MREVRCQPDVAAYNAAIRNYCIAKRLGKAFALMEEMKGRGLEPNATSYKLFFRVFYWANELVSAWRLYGRMKVQGCLPNVQSCMFLVRLCKRNEKMSTKKTFTFCSINRLEFCVRLHETVIGRGFNQMSDKIQRETCKKKAHRKCNAELGGKMTKTKELTLSI